MKNLFRLMACMLMACTMISLSSCGGTEEEELISTDNTEQYRMDIVGYWQVQNLREFWRFDADGKGTKITPSHGAYWDEADDVMEEEAGKFEWFIEQTGLNVRHWMEMDQAYDNPEVMMILSITSDTMKWKDGDTVVTLKRQNRNRQ